MTRREPFAPTGARVGLLGGSFDPPHAGHVHITRWALRTLALDRVWWLVTPGNPLKARGPADLARRVNACRRIVADRRVTVTDIEAGLGTRYTADTVAALRRRYPSLTFVWLMGADNLSGFHRWERWQGIMRTIPVAVMARPGEQPRAGLSPAARCFAQARLPQPAAAALAGHAAPAWVLLTGRMSDASSTAIRRRGDWP